MISTIPSLGCQLNRRFGKTSTSTSLWCHFRNSMPLVNFDNYFKSGCPYRSYAPQFRSKNRFCYRFHIFLADAHGDLASRCQGLLCLPQFQCHPFHWSRWSGCLLLGLASGNLRLVKSRQGHQMQRWIPLRILFLRYIIILIWLSWWPSAQRNGLVWVADAPHRHSSSGIEFVT